MDIAALAGFLNLGIKYGIKHLRAEAIDFFFRGLYSLFTSSPENQKTLQHLGGPCQPGATSPYLPSSMTELQHSDRILHLQLKKRFSSRSACFVIK